MIILLSPAKTMNLIHPMVDLTCEFKEDALKLRSSLTRMSVQHLKAFFNISEDVAHKTYDYYHCKHTYRVYDLFDGIGYRILKQNSKEMPKHIYVVSGLYGLLHISDTIFPYRLDLKHPIKGLLINFWRNKLYEKLKHEKLIISCLSKEYQELLDQRLSIIHVDIYKSNKKAPSVDAKKVRAAFASYIDQYELSDLNNFHFDNYRVSQVTSNLIRLESP